MNVALRSPRWSGELGGTTLGSQFDHVEVDGALDLEGTLNVSLINDFSPSSGNSFQIISATGGISGTFSDVSLPALPDSNWQLHYTTNSVLLQVALRGDYNFDGTVDAADYLLWRKTLGQSGFALAAGGNANNQIDPGDFNTWREHFGQSIGSGASASSTSDALADSAVPEPATLVLLMISAAGWCLRRG